MKSAKANSHLTGDLMKPKDLTSTRFSALCEDSGPSAHVDSDLGVLFRAYRGLRSRRCITNVTRGKQKEKCILIFIRPLQMRTTATYRTSVLIDHRESIVSKTETPLFISLALHPAKPSVNAGFCSYFVTYLDIGTTSNPS